MAAPSSCIPISTVNPQKNGELPAIEKGSVAQQVHHRHWMPDQRDAFIGWLRGEFAAANAIIDALCQHLQLLGAPGEYDFVIGSIQQRRFSWNGILHMQQYFSVAEVLFALQQVIMRKQQLHNSSAKPSQKGYAGAESRQRKDSSVNSRRQQQDRARSDAPKARSVTSNETSRREGENRDMKLPVAWHAEVEDNSGNASDLSHASVVQHEAEEHYKDASEEIPRNEQSPELADGQVEEPNRATVEVVEVEDAQKVNLVHGQLYNNVFSEVESTKLVQSATEILDNITGDKSCIKGKFKDSIQSSAIMSEVKEEKRTQEESPKSMPEFVKSVADHLLRQGILPSSSRPNCFTMHVIEEGKSILLEDQHIREQTLCVVSLQSESSLVFGKSGDMLNGEFQGALNISLPAGSLLKLEGSSRDAVTYAVNGGPAKRILLSLAASVGRSYIPEQDKTASTKSTTSPKQIQSSLSKRGKSACPAAVQAWPNHQPRPGTGVYIPNSNGSKCDIPMSYRPCIQDVR